MTQVLARRSAGSPTAAEAAPPPRAAAASLALGAALAAVNEKLVDNGAEVMRDYDSLRRSGPDGDKGAFANGKDRDNKNRYFNVLPYEATRVKLSGPKDYINASLLQSTAGEQPTWRYIATQGPLSNTCKDFWRMVAEQRSGVVIMITRTVESGMTKCAQYFPEAVGAAQDYGDLRVELREERELDCDITVRRLCLLHKPSGEARLVEHYHYHAWPDHGVPQTTKPLRQLAHLLETSGAHSGGPAVVHCSAGIGRTGTFCTVDVVLRRLRALPPGASAAAAAEAAVNVCGIVEQLRQQRMGMVQTPDQYLFCHLAVKEELEAMLHGTSGHV